MTIDEPEAASTALGARIDTIDWEATARTIDEQGYGVVPGLLTRAQCHRMRDLWREEAAFRKTIDMARHGYGCGHYRYFAYPLPPDIAALRTGLYAPLADIANRWEETRGTDRRFPEDHAQFLENCHAAGQTRPTPLLLRYGEGDYNRLHQDVYGEWLFPLQLIVLLSDPDKEFAGGELIVTEQRARMQSRAEIVPLRQGDAAVIAVRERPGEGKNGPVKLTMRHGVSRVRSGERYTLGIILHDAA